MTRIKIKDLPKDMKISRKEMRKVFGGAGPAPLGDISVVKNIDEASPDLLQYCCKGSNIPDVNIDIYRAGGDEGGGSLSAMPPTSLTPPTYKRK